MVICHVRRLLTFPPSGRVPQRQRQVAQGSALDDRRERMDVFGHLGGDRHDLCLHR